MLRSWMRAPARHRLRSFEKLSGEAHAVTMAAVTVRAVSDTARDNAGARSRDAAALTADGSWSYDADPMQAQLIAALHRYGEDKFGGRDGHALVELLAAYDDAGLRGVMNGTQGAALELQVDAMFDAGQLAYPEGVASHKLVDNHAKAIDGVFFDGEGNVVGNFQVKASRTAGPVREHLDKYPDVDDVYVNSEAAAAADRAGLDVVDTRVSLEQLLPDGLGAMPGAGVALTDELVTSIGEQLLEVASELPAVAALMIGAEWGWARLRGGDAAVVDARALSRAKSGGALFAGGAVLSAATGLDSARVVVVVGGKAGGWALSRLDAEVAATVSHIRQLREVVGALAA